MTRNYYEILGIAPDADDDAIKAGFRRARSAAHPDREGGSDELMALVNRAHDCLTDPERRLIYDATGVDQPSGDQVKELTEQLLDKRATESLRILFNDLIDKAYGWELLEACRNAVALRIHELPEQEGTAKGRAAKISAKLGRVRMKKAGATNLVEEALLAAIERASDQAESATTTLRIIRRVQVLLQDYDADKPLPKSAVHRPARSNDYGVPFDFLTGSFR